MDLAIAAAIEELAANSPKQMGAVIKAARARLEGKTVDGKALSDKVRVLAGAPRAHELNRAARRRLSRRWSPPMTLPETIPVRYSEEEAGYVSFRPVVRQSFRLNELLDMVLSVTGKEPARIRQILRSGNVVFHFYRYWWQGFEVSEDELQKHLARFPDPDPTRAFRADACTAVLLEGGGKPDQHLLELERAGASRRRLLRRQSLWQALLSMAATGPLTYGGYSYLRRADLYRLELTAASRSALTAAAESLAPRDLRRALRAAETTAHLVFVCPRNAPGPVRP